MTTNNMLTTEDAARLLRSFEFCSRLEKIARITARGKEAGLEISRYHDGSGELHWSDVEEGEDVHAPQIYLPDKHVRVISIHSHPNPLHSRIVSPSTTDVSIDHFREFYSGIVSVLNGGDVGLVVYKTQADVGVRDERRDKKVAMYKAISAGHLDEDKLFQTQDEVLSVLRSYFSFAEFLKYKKTEEGYVSIGK